MLIILRCISKSRQIKPKLYAWLDARIKWNSVFYLVVILIHQPFMLFSQHIMSTKSVSVKLCLHKRAAYSLSVSDLPLRQFPPTSPSFMCPKHIPSSHFIPPLHPSHVLKFISLYLPTLVSPLPSLHLAYLSAALLAQWQSHHTLSIRLVRPGRSAAQHRTALVWSHQCQSVSLTLSVTLKRFRLPDIVCPPPLPCAPLQVRRCGGGGVGGIELESKFRLALDLISLDIFSSLSLHTPNGQLRF